MTIDPPRAAQVLPVTIPTEQMEKSEKFRSSSWTCPVSLTSNSWGEWLFSPMFVPFSESEDGIVVFSVMEAMVGRAGWVLFEYCLDGRSDAGRYEIGNCDFVLQ